jgi:hypothetical protein
MTARGGVPTPPKLRNMEPRGVRPTPSESRNGGTVTYHPWQRNEPLQKKTNNNVKSEKQKTILVIGNILCDLIFCRIPSPSKLLFVRVLILVRNVGEIFSIKNYKISK